MIMIMLCWLKRFFLLRNLSIYIYIYAVAHANSALARTERTIACNDPGGAQEWRLNATRWSSGVEARFRCLDGQCVRGRAVRAFFSYLRTCLSCVDIVIRCRFSAGDAHAPCDERKTESRK